MDKPNEFTEKKIANSRRILQHPYAHLNDTGGFDAMISKQEASTPLASIRRHMQNPYAFLNGSGTFDSVELGRARSLVGDVTEPRIEPVNGLSSYASIEQKARTLQVAIWNRRQELWPNGVPSDPVKLLDPSVAIKCLGYKYDLSEYLGDFDNQGIKREVAGMIDRTLKQISVSRRLPHNTRRFTTAHEIGHAVLHRETLMHRDRPIDGVFQKNERRDAIEIEADKFATYFLMPKKLLKLRFKQVFGMDVFTLTEDSVFALDPANQKNLLSRCKQPRELARTLAKAEHYNGRHIHSLAEQFGVSIEAMAIRIEELKLIEI